MTPPTTPSTAPLSDNNIEKLLAKARAVLNSDVPIAFDWKVHKANNCLVINGAGETIAEMQGNYEIDYEIMEGRAAFIAAADPSVIVNLCERVLLSAQSGTDVAKLQAKLAREEKAHENTVDERDDAEQALSQAYFLIIGKSADWSSNFGYNEALEEIDDAQSLLRHSVTDVAKAVAFYEKRMDIISLLTDIAPMLDVIKGEWSAEGMWSPWDQGLRDRITLQLFDLTKDNPNG